MGGVRVGFCGGCARGKMWMRGRAGVKKREGWREKVRLLRKIMGVMMG